MPQSEEYRRGYSAGYHAGLKRVERERRELETQRSEHIPADPFAPAIEHLKTQSNELTKLIDFLTRLRAEDGDTNWPWHEMAIG